MNGGADELINHHPIAYGAIMNDYGYAVTRVLSTALLCLATMTGSALYAQSSLDLLVDRPTRIISADGYTTFVVDIHNTSAQPVLVKVVRMVNDLPDDGWKTSICSPHHCYDETVDTIEPYEVHPGQPSNTQVHFYTGDSGVGRVMLKIDPQDGTDPAQIELTVEVGEIPEPSLSLREDSTEAHVGVGDTAFFPFAIVNRTDSTLPVEVHRLEEEFPDPTWSSGLCYFFVCQPAELDSLPIHPVPSRDGAVYGLFVVAGQTPGTIGEVEVQIDPGDGTEPFYRRFEVTVEMPAGIEEREGFGNSSALSYPSPATSHVSLTIPGGVPGTLVSLRLIGTTGATITTGPFHTESGVDGETVVILPVDGLPSGLWLWQATHNGVMVEGRFVVLR